MDSSSSEDDSLSLANRAAASLSVIPAEYFTVTTNFNHMSEKRSVQERFLALKKRRMRMENLEDNQADAGSMTHQFPVHACVHMKRMPNEHNFIIQTWEIPN